MGRYQLDQFFASTLFAVELFLLAQDDEFTYFTTLLATVLVYGHCLSSTFPLGALVAAAALAMSMSSARVLDGQFGQFTLLEEV